MNKYSNVLIAIPTYEPDTNKMMDFIDELKINFKNILVINDGCNIKYNEFFKDLENKNIVVINHDKNYGKGKGIKTALKYFLKNKFTTIVTVDCDGQHSVNDVIKCANKSIENPNDLIIGCRNFDKKNVPFKSKYGNKITRNIFKIFVGLSITDTQTGLRAMGIKPAKIFKKTNGDKFDYETNELIECKKYDINIIEVPIKTIYINHNSGSHFNPFKDSVNIYRLFIKYIIGAFSSSLIDLLLFYLLFIGIKNIKNSIMISTIIARLISSLYNYIFNKRIVFKRGSKYSIIKYYILVVIQMLFSGLILTFINLVFKNKNLIILKIIIDTIIFFINFIIQEKLIYKSVKYKKSIEI